MQQVRYCRRHNSGGHYLRELFKWVGRRLAASTHLAIHIDYLLWKGFSYRRVDDPLRHFLGSNPMLNINLETLDLTIGDWWTWFDDAALLGWLQDWVLSSCSRLKTMSLPLHKAPTWLMQCPSLQHLCLFFPRNLTKIGLFTELSASVNHMNLPNLQTLFLQGEGDAIGGIDFQGSDSLGVMHAQNCWLDELLLPPSCQLRVAAQHERLIAQMHRSREHPLVSNASYVSLPTDLAARVIPYGSSDDEDEREPRTSAVGIPDIFSQMCSLHLTWPDEDYRKLPWRSRKKDWDRCMVRDGHVVPYHEDCFTSFIPLRCLPKQWRHGNLKELLIEGDKLGVVIPPLPNLATLLVSCKENLALDFTDPDHLGRTITRMVFSARSMHFKAKQKQELCRALKARGLQLAGDCRGSRCRAVQKVDDPNPGIAELEEQHKNGFECKCGACPSCLGIGIEMLEREDPSDNGDFHIQSLKRGII